MRWVVISRDRELKVETATNQKEALFRQKLHRNALALPVREVPTLIHLLQHL
ncbi:hypothetical protein [Thermococcus sp.]|uniref:hypothetical protein n=1 Tax=Thermococcus sp. TaxID=35749 RepID=UPI0026184AC8|nr:hypothetical protein [Thermococcus sp.]